MKIIPKNTKMKKTLFKNYTLFDLLFMLVFVGIIFAVATSNINKFLRIGICAVILLIAVILFFPKGEELVYYRLLRIIKFYFEKKVYKKKCSKFGEYNIAKFVPHLEITEEGYIKYPKYYGAVISLKSVDFALQDAYTQEHTIDLFARVLNKLDLNLGADLVKVDRPIILDSFTDELIDKFWDAKKDKLRQGIILSRMNAIEDCNKKNVIISNRYFLVVYGNTIESLEETLSNLETDLNATGILEDKLNQVETAVFLKYCILNDFNERDITESSNLIDEIRPTRLEFKKDKYIVNKQMASVITIKDYPIEVLNAWGEDLFGMKDTKVVMHISPVGQSEAVRRLDEAVREVNIKDGLNKASEIIGNDIHFETLKALLVSMQTANESLFDVSITITCYAENEKKLQEHLKSVKQTLRNGGFKTDSLIYEQQAGYINGNISAVSKLKRFERGIGSISLASCFPFLRPTTLEPNGVFLGTTPYGEPFIFDIWKRGRDYQNSNAFVIGTSGSGKSFFTKTFLTALWGDDCNIFILDPENEYNIMAKNLGGTMIDVGNSTSGRLNPFHIYNMLMDDGEPADGAVLYSSHLRTLESFFKIVFEGASFETLELINNVVVEAYKKKGIDETLDLEQLKSEDFPIFDDIYQELLLMEQNCTSEVIQKQVQLALLYIKKFVGSGRYAQIWNGHSTLQASTKFTIFNFQSLFANNNAIVANAQMLLVFRFLEQEIINRREENLSGDKIIHTVVIADEAHKFIDPRFPISLDFFFNMAKRIRKYEGAFVPITQSISDWNANDEVASKTTAILKESQYNFILKLKPNGLLDLAELFEKGGAPLNEEEQAYIKEAETGGMFFVGNEHLRTCFHVVPDSFSVEIFKNKFANVHMYDNTIHVLEKDLEKANRQKKHNTKKLTQKDSTELETTVAENNQIINVPSGLLPAQSNDTPPLERPTSIKEKKKIKLFSAITCWFKKTFKFKRKTINTSNKTAEQTKKLSKKDKKKSKFFDFIVAWFKKVFAFKKRQKNLPDAPTPPDIPSCDKSHDEEEKAQ